MCGYGPRTVLRLWTSTGYGHCSSCFCAEACCTTQGRHAYDISRGWRAPPCHVSVATLGDHRKRYARDASAPDVAGFSVPAYSAAFTRPTHICRAPFPGFGRVPSNSCIPCEAHGKVVLKNNHRSRRTGSWGHGCSCWTSHMHTDNMYVACVCHGTAKY